MKLLVDTGSDYTILATEIITDLGYDLQKARRHLRISTGSGAIEAPVINVVWFNCLGERAEKFPIVAYSLPETTFVDGLLGMDFLTRVRAIIPVGDASIQCP